MDQKKPIPELNYLLTQVEKHYGRRVATTTDFEALSVVIERETGELLSSSTLKRLWGYVTSHPMPRLSTLDILSRFVGFRDFRLFCESLKSDAAFSSNFLTVQSVFSADLKPGDILTIGWNPDRLVKLRYEGNNQYAVTESMNAKLMAGNRFELAHLMKGYPLYIPRILRDNAYTSAYIAGTDGGLTLLRVENLF